MRVAMIIVDAARLEGIAFSGGPQRGAFWIDVDHMEMR